MLKTKTFAASSVGAIDEQCNNWLFITRLSPANLIKVSQSESAECYTMSFCYVSTDMEEGITLDKALRIMITSTQIRITDEYYHDLQKENNSEIIGKYDWTITGINQDGTIKLTNGIISLDEVSISCLDIKDFII